MTVSRFLPDPSAIRAALHQLSQQTGNLDIAVAFIGSDWWDLLGNFSGRIRAVCWLSSTNTNPYAVADMLRRPTVQVKQRDSMHAKVYLVPHRGAIVGSANLSKAALNHLDTAGQSEAGVLVEEKGGVRAITRWFQDLWIDAETREITQPDLARAYRGWNLARSSDRRPSGGKRPPMLFLPQLSQPVPTRLLRLSREVRGLRLETSLGKPYAFISALNPKTVSPAQRLQIVEYLTEWNKRRWVSAELEREPVSKVRTGLTILFDESIDLRDRLARIEREGLLPGLRIPSLSLLLYWRKPRRYLPFNKKTNIFLRDYKLRLRGAGRTSAATYANWIAYSTQLQQWLKLPTPGHVDRVVSAHYSRFAKTA
jgi:hypothetical protein